MQKLSMFRRNVFLVLLLSTLLLAYVAHAGPVMKVGVDHAIAFDRQLGAGEERSFGSRSMLIRGELVRYTAAVSASYRSYTVFVPCGEHLTKLALQQLTASGSSTSAKGLIVELCDHDMTNEKTLSFFFSTTAVDIPVYFLPHSAASKELLQHLLAAAEHRTTERVVLSVAKTVKLSELVANSTLASSIIEGQYVYNPTPAAKEPGMTPSTPQVLVAAHFDSLGVSPASRTSGGASGAVAAIELWRRLTSMPSARQKLFSPYGVTMILGSTSRFNYAGTTAWISQHTDEELDAFRLVLCLDELLPPPETSKDAPDLYLHVQDALMKRQHGKLVVEQVDAAAKALGISLKVVSAKTNYQHYDLRFEHEVFASRQMAAMTLSTHRNHHIDQIFRDVRRPPMTAADAALLAKRVDFVEAIVRIITGAASSAESATSVWPGSASHIHGMMEYSREWHRSPVVHSGADLRQYADDVGYHMRAQAAAVQQDAFISASSVVTHQRLRTTGVTLFGPYEETMEVFLSKSYLFECAVAVAVSVALAAFLHVEVGLSTVPKLFTQ